MAGSATTLLTELGVLGLLGVMFIEGSSLPFPGVILALTYGYILSPTFNEAALLGVAMTAIYTSASFIPYLVSKKIGHRIMKRWPTKIATAQALFKEYGGASIALTRPFSIGNYIPYIAGLSKVSSVKFGALTAIGIYPWCVAVLLVGKLCRGNIALIQSIYYRYDLYIYLCFAFCCVVYILYRRRSK